MMSRITHKLIQNVMYTRSNRTSLISKHGRSYSTVENREHMLEWIDDQPKVELHRHLEGSVGVGWIHETYKHNPNHPHLKRFKPNYETWEDLSADIVLKKPMKNLEEVLDRLSVFQQCWTTIDRVRDLCFQTIFQAALNEGHKKIEIRFSPEYMAEPWGLDWNKMFEAMLDSKRLLEDTFTANFDIGFVAIASRNYGAVSADKTIEFVKRWRNEIVGFDLAASEDAHPPEVFLKAIEQCHQMGLGITVHSGEGTTAEHIEQVVKLFQPHRIGHATALIQSPKVMELVRDRKICVEACPTSNIITNCVKSYAEHPLKTYFDFGIPVCLNTDDPTLFDTTLNDEWMYVHEHLRMSKEDLLKMNDYADKYSFVKTKPRRARTLPSPTSEL